MTLQEYQIEWNKWVDSIYHNSKYKPDHDHSLYDKFSKWVNSIEAMTVEENKNK